MIDVGDKRRIQFNKNLRYERQKDYDISQYEYENFGFDGASGNKDKRVYKNFNFSVFVDDFCNADCKFCVAQLRYSHRKELYEKKHIEDDDEYIRRLDYIFSLIRPLNPSISITGGEPTLSRRLDKVIKLIDEYDFRKRTITTNGSGLLKNAYDKSYTILDALIDHKFDHLNISRASYIDEKNKMIMCYKDNYCDNNMIKEILSIANSSDLKHRLSCLLLQESVNSVLEIKKYIEYYEELGANNFIFRELMDFASDSINKEKIKYCIDNKVKLNDIWEDFAVYKEFEPYLNILGYYYYVEIYHYRNMTVASESANLNQQYMEKSKNPDMVYEMIFHTNGNLCGSWVDHEEVLDEYKGCNNK